MSEIQIRFRCGHREAFTRADQMEAVACAQCGERRVAGVTAPPPTFRATECDVRGPLVQESK